MKQGQCYLQDLVERQGIPVFDDITVALSCIPKLVSENKRPQDLTLEDNANPVKYGHLPLGDKLIQLKEIFDSLDVENEELITLSDVRLAFRSVTGRDLSNECFNSIINVISKNESVHTIDVYKYKINFDEFCCIISEFSRPMKINTCSLELTSIPGRLFRFLEWIWDYTLGIFMYSHNYSFNHDIKVSLFYFTQSTLNLIKMIKCLVFVK